MATSPTAQASTPKTAKAGRHPSPVMRPRAVGGTRKMPSPMPPEMIPMARPRRTANQRVAVAARGT